MWEKLIFVLGRFFLFICRGGSGLAYNTTVSLRRRRFLLLARGNHRDTRKTVIITIQILTFHFNYFLILVANH